MSTLVQTMNGLTSFLIQREDLIISTLSEKYGFDLEDATKAVAKVLDASKVKSIKPQVRQPKGADNKSHKKRDPSAYSLFCNDVREQCKTDLATNANARTFKDKTGETIVIDEKEFKEGVPTFTHLTRKMASMWWQVTPDERKKYETEAKNRKALSAENAEEESVSEKKEKKEKKTPAKTKNSKSKKVEVVEEEEEEQPEEEEEEESTTASTSTKSKKSTKKGEKKEKAATKKQPAKKETKESKGKGKK